MRIVPVRFPQEDVALLKKVSRASQESVSHFIRRLVRKEFVSLDVVELDDLERKALGLNEGGRK